MIKLLACVSMCVQYDDKFLCYFDLKPKCEIYETICKESSVVACKNVVTNLGDWNIIPNDYTPAPYTGPAPETTPPSSQLQTTGWIY